MAYSVDYVPDAVVSALRGSHNLGVFMRMDTDPVCAVWLGVNDIPAKMQSIDVGSITYLGGGRLQNVPDFDVLMNGTADRIEITMSGVDPAQLAVYDVDDWDVRGEPVHIGVTALDQDFQPLSDIIPLWEGIASFVDEQSSPATGTDGFSVTLSLSVGTGLVTRSYPSASLWSDAQQQALFPGDRGCENTARLARGAYPTWPRF